VGHVSFFSVLAISTSIVHLDDGKTKNDRRYFALNKEIFSLLVFSGHSQFTLYRFNTRTGISIFVQMHE